MKKLMTFAFAAAFAVAGTASAASVEELQAQIDALLAQLAGISSTTTTTGYTFNNDLTIGSEGADVVALQSFLESKGTLVIPAGVSKGYFGSLTRSALASYQAMVGISPAAGYFGPITRANVNASSTVVIETETEGTTGGSNGLSGGAGSIDNFDEISGISNEEVGENEEVVIAGIEIENSDESDIELLAVRLDFSTQPGNDDLDEFIDEVIIMLEGEEIATVDADEFDDDNNWTRTVSVDAPVIDADDTVDLEVAVVGVNNIDTGDAGDDWGLDFVSVRFEDAQGAVVTENTNTDEFSWDVVEFSDSADIEFKITSGDDDINDARAINVDADDETDNEDLFSFEVEIEGNSDVEIKDLLITATMPGTADTLNDMFSELRLEVDGEEVGSENAPASLNLVFDDIDVMLDAGETYEFVLSGDILDTSATLVEGDTVSFAFGETETDSASTDIEDEEGDDLVDADMTGSANSDAHGVYDSGIFAEFVSSSSDVDSSGIATVADIGTFKIVFDVTAFDSDVYVDGSAITDEAGGATYQDIDADGMAATAVLESTADDAANDTFKVDEDETERFTLTVSGDGTDAFANASLESILYALTAIDGDVVYNFNMDDFEADSVYLKTN